MKAKMRKFPSGKDEMSLRKSKLKLKKGDVVWVSLPANATILRVNKRQGYTLKTDDGEEWACYNDAEVSLVKTPILEKKK